MADCYNYSENPNKRLTSYLHVTQPLTKYHPFCQTASLWIFEVNQSYPMHHANT